MPTEGTPVLFGDLSKYLVIDREHLRLRELKELYAMDDRTGYLGFSFLDGRLTKRDAVKILRIL
jgi:HK97 family phage major capsid protein